MPEMGGSYYTFATENNYMIWTFLKKCWEKGWLYQGADVMPWCPRCATAISQHEIVTDGYREITHRSVTVRFPLRDRPGESLLVWTTTPWTLTSNVAAAVGADLDYVKVRNGDHVLYLSKGTLHMLRGEYEVLGELKGRDMVGWTYDGPFDDLPAAQRPAATTRSRTSQSGRWPAPLRACTRSSLGWRGRERRHRHRPHRPRLRRRGLRPGQTARLPRPGPARR